MKTDSFWKEILEKFFEPFLKFFFPNIHDVIDFSKKYQFLDKEFQQISHPSKSSKKIVDKLVKVYLKNGNEKWILIHIEVQGQKEEEFAKRMFIYYYRIFDKYQKDVISLALLTDKDSNYRPNEFTKKFLGLSLAFKFPLVKIVDYINYNFEEQYENNIFAIIAHAFLKTLETEGDYQNRFNWKRQFILHLYKPGIRHETLVEIYRFIEWIMVLPESLDNQIYSEIKQFEEQNKMSYILYAERKGLQKGKIEGLRKAIESVLEVKFGTVDKQISKDLLKINSLKKLERLLEKAKLTDSLTEFRELL